MHGDTTYDTSCIYSGGTFVKLSRHLTWATAAVTPTVTFLSIRSYLSSYCGGKNIVGNYSVVWPSVWQNQLKLIDFFMWTRKMELPNNNLGLWSSFLFIDLETVGEMAFQGLKFTLLSRWQLATKQEKEKLSVCKVWLPKFKKWMLVHTCDLLWLPQCYYPVFSATIYAVAYSE